MNPVRDLRYALDPVAFAEACGIVPDAWQRDALIGGHRRVLMCCCRQSGKSTVSALAALHTACFDPPALVLLVSPSQRQSGELFRKVMGFYRELPDAPELALESVLRAEFRNGSRIVSLPGSGDTVRGFSAPQLVVLDEAARVPDDLLAAIRPTQATVKGGGRLLALSTPSGRRGWFYEAFEHGGPEWRRYRVPADECPRITKEFLEAERRELGDLLYRQEYCVEFVDSGEQLLPTLLLEMAVSTDVPALRLLA